uniref:Epidermal patterning factor-like protein n=1 Tax=Opuntia streptacantha TaxID=393608 RepID=A0A7C8ZDR6_OPUST
MHPSSRRCQDGVRLAITATLIIVSLMIFSSESDEMISNSKKKMTKKLVLGSRPPSCVNKCKSCKPCIATLVVPPRHLNKASSSNSIPSSTPHEYGGNNHDTYYLLSWKCKCGNKLFQP